MQLWTLETRSVLGSVKNLIFNQSKFKKQNNELYLCPTYDCNSHCSFCQSASLKKMYNKKEMSIEDFTVYIDWLRKQNMKIVTFLGGEVTCYSKLVEALDICRSRKIKVFLCTNLLFNKRILKSLTPDVIDTLSAHYQLPECYSAKEHKLFLHNLASVSKKGYPIILKHHFLAQDSPYDYVIEAALKYNIKHIRTSIIRSEFNKNRVGLNLEEMKKIAPSMVSFAKKCIKNGIILIIRMPHPLCIFSENDRKYLIKNAGLKGTCFYSRFIGFVAEYIAGYKKIISYINPDLTFYFCPGCNLKSEKRITDYKSLEEVHDCFWKTFKKKQWTPYHPECKQCNFFNKKICQGGCLSYKQDCN